MFKNCYHKSMKETKTEEVCVCIQSEGEKACLATS